MQRIYQLWPRFCFGVAICLIAGCGDNPQLKEMTKRPFIPKTAHWPELDAFIDNPNFEVPSVRKLMRSMGGGEISTGTRQICNQLNHPKFQENFKKFEETPIPAEHDTPDRQETKKKLVATVRDLVNGCKKNADVKVMQASVTKLPELITKISEIPNQTPPAE